MINSQKSNKRLLRKRKRLKEIQQEFRFPKNLARDFEQVDTDELDRIKTQQKHFQKEDRNRFYLILGVTIILMLSLLFWVISTDYSKVIELID